CPAAAISSPTSPIRPRRSCSATAAEMSTARWPRSSPPWEDDMAELADIVALRQVAERYAVAVDRNDAALFAAQFTEDGALIALRGEFVGREALAGVPPMVKERYRRTFHAVLNQVLAIAGDTAE